MLFFEIKGDDDYKLEHLDIIMFPVGDKLVIGIFYRGQEMSTDRFNMAQNCPLFHLCCFFLCHQSSLHL